jgi:hypothetical protein
METDTIQMSKQLASIDRRLTAVEYEVAGLKRQVDTLTEAVAVLTTEVGGVVQNGRYQGRHCPD